VELALLLDIGAHELVLGREVVVEGRLRHPGLGDDAVDADCVDALGIEEGGGRGYGAGRRRGNQPGAAFRRRLRRPYSNATRGNIPVTLTIMDRALGAATGDL
jgi:hypothetical protein